MAMRVISYGGGVQSTALIVLACQGDLGRVDAALFANVGDDSEHPATVRYVREVMTPWARNRGVLVHELHRRTRHGEIETLWGRLMREGSRSLPIPVRMSNGAPGTRSCTMDHKITVIGRWLKAQGAKPMNRADVLVGISWDEVERVGNRRTTRYDTPVYPLCDRRLTRHDCQRIIENAGLPVPPKSACFFCPFHRPATWARMRRDEPLLFAKSLALEQTLNERRALLGKVPVWLTRFNAPLDTIPEEQPSLPGMTGETCDEGYCWT